MSSEKRGLDEVNFVDASILLDAVTSLISTFKQAGYSPPTSIQVDKLAFDELLEEASKLYSSVNVRDSIANKEFSLANILNIVLEGGKEEVGDQEEHYRPLQEQKDSPQALKSIEDNHEKQHLGMSTTITNECPDCGATFDTPAGHRKHYQAFHGKLEEPKVIEQAEI